MLRYYVVLAALALIGVACAVYVLSNQGQGGPDPWRSVYEVRIELTEADGVAPGIGQPVTVAGVAVGSVVRTEHTTDANALVTLEIEHDQLPRVYANATASLEPITPLKDMRIELDPGGPPAPALRERATIRTARTSTPVPLSEFLASLDADTRTYLTSLIAALDRGTRDQGENIRRMLRALGPTTAQVRQITEALAQRRRPLARLVHNLAVVTRAASRDEELAGLVVAGNQTLQALAEQEAPLRRALARLPGTLESTRATLGHAATLADELRPTLDALLPPVRQLPATFAALRPFADATRSTLLRQVRPLVVEAQPLVRDLGTATSRLAALAPNMTSALQALNYAFNELAYNPPGDDEGFLFWLAWWAHNWLDAGALSGDAHGGVARVMLAASCRSSEGAFGEIAMLLNVNVGLPATCPEG
ncbi:MAG: MlaD family protein [Thermoleophilaceae bacterium]